MMLDLYTNIKKMRISLGMTQSELAKKLGYADKSMIAKIEKGLVDRPQSKIFSFAAVLGTTASELMGSIEDEAEINAYVLAQIAVDEELMTYVRKLCELTETGKQKVYGYIDSLTNK